MATARRGRQEAAGAPRTTHILADLWGCRAALLRDEDAIRRAMLDAALAAGATVVHTTFHRFAGGGVTGVVAVQESHLTIHTWPERGYAAVDIFLCGRADPQAALAHLVQVLGAARCETHEHVRGEASPRTGAAEVGPSWTTMGVLYLVTFVVAMCSLLYELVLAQTLSALLGNTVLRYSVTIGCYLGALGLGALLCSSRLADAARRLVRVEVALSALGGASVPLFYFLDTAHRYLYSSVPSGSAWETVGAVGFLLATHAVIVAIGLLSGFEIPLLLTLGEELRPGVTNRVLGVDYFGALVGSVLFPLVLLRSFGLLATAFIVALLNAVAAGVLIAWRTEARHSWGAFANAALAAALLAGLVAAGSIEQFFLKKFYYAEDTTSLSALLAPQPARPEVARYRSPYQTIDLVRQESGAQWVYDAIGAAPERAGYPRDLWLYIDREYQLFSGIEALYHEWLVHAPPQAVGRPPRLVLVLGGGDGAAVREVLKYPSVRRVVRVDIDPTMLRLAREHPLLTAINERADLDPRVEVVLDDAFRWLRASVGRFDAIYIDMPYARDYNLSMLYSREFYTLARHRLAPGGFVAIDAPMGSCATVDSLWPIYSSTLRAAGFRTVVPLLSRTDVTAPRVAAAIQRMAARANIEIPLAGGRALTLTAEQRERYFEGVVAAELEGSVQEFILALPGARALNTTWRDFGVRLRMFAPSHLPLAFDSTCASEFDTARVNSIFRPTLPPLEFATVRFP